jgi:MFS family permease
VWLGSGVIGGIGLGLGYISPVSTLVKWFPDRRGMATGMAIMRFGGGAMIGAPLANILMNPFKSATDVGAWQTFIAMGAIYFFFMIVGAFRYRLPPTGWRPDGWMPPSETKMMITHDRSPPELGFNALSGDQKAAIAAIAAGFAGLLSLFNIGGRFFWASLSDYIGRKNIYYTFFILGIEQQ